MDFEKTVPLMFRARVQADPDIIAQASKNEKGVFEYFSYQHLYNDVIRFACGLQKLGMRRGDNVALIADNRREWLISDLAILSLGAADVPRGKDSMAHEIRFIIGFAGCVYGIFENERQLEKVLEKPSDAPLLKTAIVFDTFSVKTVEKAKAVGMNVYSFNDVMNLASSDENANKSAIEAEMEKTKTDDVATIIFTSGTTGTPKGVMLTHESYMAQMEVVTQVLNVQKGDMWLSVLPVWHSFERAVQYYAITFTSGIAYSRPIAPVMLADIAAIKPQYICGVPRLWNGLANAVIGKMKKTGGAKYALFRFFLAVGKKYVHAKERVLGRICHFKKKSRTLEVLSGIVPFILLFPLNALGGALVFAKIKEKLGGRLKAAISGGGALQKDVDDFYRAVGINILEGYGITEAGPVLSCRYEHSPKSNCVGKVYPSAEIKIVAEKNGEIVSSEPLPPGSKGLILARGKTKHQIMKGYYNRRDLTEKVIDADGWLNTGDIGMLSANNEIKITGRAKDTIVLLGGENIEPLLIEQSLCSSSFIETAMLLGQDQKYLGALLVPAKDAVIAWAEENGVSYDEYETLLQLPEVQTLIRGEVDRTVSSENGFRPCERVFRFALLSEKFSVGKELSAKQELIRYKVCELYQSQIEKIFAQDE